LDTLLSLYFPDLNAKQWKQFQALPEVYGEWNEKINVISRKDMDQLMLHHVLHSLAIAKFISFKPGTEVLDLGTGGGFPGIPLAILFPEVKFHLVDSIGKKIKVVEAVAQALGLDNVQATQARAEALTHTYEFVVSRAVTKLSPLFQWVRGKINPHHFHAHRNGIICLKGGDLTEELEAFNRKHKVIELSEYFQEEFFESKKLVYVPF